MERIILALCLLISSVVSAQPGYTTINARYKWIAGGFDSSLIIPRYNGTPSGLRSQWLTDGQIALDTLNSRFYIYSGGVWNRVANYSEIGSTYTFPYSVVAPGNAIQLENDTIPFANGLYTFNSAARRTWQTKANFLSGYVTQSALDDTADAIRGGFPTGGGGIYEESVVKVADSVYLDGEKALPPSANKFYGRNNSNSPGYHSAAVINLTNIQNKQFLNYKNGEWVNTQYFQEMRFVTGDSAYILNGDSTLTDTSFYSRKLNVFREGLLQYKDDTLSGYEIIDDSTMVVHPPAYGNERFIIHVYDTLQWNTITAGLAPASEVCVDFNVSGDLTESPACTWGSAAGTGQGYSTTSLANGTDGYFVIKNINGSTATVNPIGLDDAANNSTIYTAWEYVVYRFSGFYYYIDNAATVAGGTIAAADNDLVRLNKVGTVVKAQYSSDNGVTWNDIHTYSLSANHTLYAKTHFPLGGYIIQDAKVLNFQ